MNTCAALIYAVARVRPEQRSARFQRLGMVSVAVLAIFVLIASGYDTFGYTSAGFGEVKTAVSAVQHPRLYLTGRNGDLRTIDSDSGAVLGTVSTNAWTTGLAVNQEGTRAYVINGWIGTVTVIDTRAEKIVARIQTLAQLDSAVLRPDGQRLYVSGTQNGQGAVWAFDTATNTVSAVILTGAAPTKLATDPSGSRLYVVNSQGSSVTVIDTHNATVVGTATVAALPQNVAVSLDSGTSYVVSTNRSETDTGSVTMLDNGTEQVTRSFSVGKGAADLALSANGSRLLVANTQDGTVSVINTARGKVLSTLNMAAVGMAANPHDHVVYVATERSVIAVDSSSGLIDAEYGPAGLSGKPFLVTGIALSDSPNG